MLENILEIANYVLFMDHHPTTHEDTSTLINKYKNKLKYIYDTNESGVSLVWNTFFDKTQQPLFVKYIKDNDTGSWKHKDTMPFITSLHINYPTRVDKETIKKWNKLFNNKTVEHMIKKGDTYLEYEKYILNMNSNRYSIEEFPGEKLYNDHKNHFKKIGQYKAAVINGFGCPNITSFASTIMRKLENKIDFCVFWQYYITKKEYVVSFRSETTDVGSIAKILGGGGHTLAASASFPSTTYNITDLFGKESLPRK